MWDSLPLDALICRDNEAVIPQIVDYACGAGHFLSEGFTAVNDCLARHGMEEPPAAWEESKLYGIEKDYRLARVSKIALFMHGAGKGNIIFGDGLENYSDKNILPNTFDILVANPPYAVSAFKQHLKLKDNDFSVLDKITNDGSEIETLFVERIAQLVKPLGVAAVILPSSILNKENGSFVAAREFLLTNFYIRAIAQFGSKTFGATGTNTVVMFLQKFDEPPKRIDLVADSVEAIKENRALDDWDDKKIFDGYLSKIGVDATDYREFLSRGRDYDEWDDVPYFAAYAAAFLASAEYTTKAKQRSFIAAAENEQRLWCNAHFYDFAIAKESEKLTFFALCYRQTTLIISAPDDNKGQEDFLGYTWSNRKGQEGIQIKREGGLMYRPDDRTAEDTLAALVRGSFAGEEKAVSDLAPYYYYLPLTDMLDFSGVEFNKAIKTTKARNTTIKDGMTAYKLNGTEFEVSIGNRVVSSEIEENGAYPVYSANVFEPFGRINKQNITDFSKPSILWGIDGDWMVNYIPENQPFYPTDHCGVLRVNTKEILPKYLALALRIEGEYEKFSRSNRASTQRIKNLTVQVPEKSVQKKIVAEIDAIDKKIQEQKETVRKCDEDITAKFVEMFGDYNRFEKIQNIATYITKGTTPTTLGFHFVDEGINFIKVENIGEIGEFHSPFMKIDKNCDNAMNRSKLAFNDILFSIAGTLGRTALVPKDILPANTNQALAIIRMSDRNMLPIFVLYALRQKKIKMQIAEMQKGANRQNLSLQDIANLTIPVPPIDLQKQFAAFVEQRDKAKRNAQKRKEALLVEREQAIEKYFR